MAILGGPQRLPSQLDHGLPGQLCLPPGKNLAPAWVLSEPKDPRLSPSPNQEQSLRVNTKGGLKTASQHCPWREFLLHFP